MSILSTLYPVLRYFTFTTRIPTICHVTIHCPFNWVYKIHNFRLIVLAQWPSQLCSRVSTTSTAAVPLTTFSRFENAISTRRWQSHPLKQSAVHYKATAPGSSSHSTCVSLEKGVLFPPQRTYYPRTATSFSPTIVSLTTTPLRRFLDGTRCLASEQIKRSTASIDTATSQATANTIHYSGMCIYANVVKPGFLTRHQYRGSRQLLTNRAENGTSPVWGQVDQSPMDMYPHLILQSTRVPQSVLCGVLPAARRRQFCIIVLSSAIRYPVFRIRSHCCHFYLY